MKLYEVFVPGGRQMYADTQPAGVSTGNAPSGETGYMLTVPARLHPAGMWAVSFAGQIPAGETCG